MRKLQYHIKFNILERYEKLLQFCKERRFYWAQWIETYENIIKALSPLKDILSKNPSEEEKENPSSNNQNKITGSQPKLSISPNKVTAKLTTKSITQIKSKARDPVNKIIANLGTKPRMAARIAVKNITFELK